MTIRERLEERERETLSRHAALACASKGRRNPIEEHDFRTAYQRDRDRILHSKAFRRLKGKTQVFLAPEGDHYRTRLTHTLEVSQISRTVTRALFLNEDLAEAIALGHDLGHTPFGHAGEAVLNEVYGPGFRHYEQSLRVVDHLEPTRRGRGLNLTHEVRDGILLHSKGKAILTGRTGQTAETMEGRVMSVCDAIAYINHDIDDALRAGIIREEDLPQEALDTVGRSTAERIDSMAVALIEGTCEDRVDIVPEVKEAMNALRDYLYKEVYPRPEISREIVKAKNIVRSLYEYLLADPSEEVPEGDDEPLERRVVDAVASMTDHYALQLYQRLFFPDAWPA